MTGVYQPENAGIADLDGSGRDDVIVLHVDRRTPANDGNTSLRVLMNDGNGGLTDRTADWLGTRFQDYVGGFFDYQVVDVNGDNRADVVFTTQPTRFQGSPLDAQVMLLLNQGGARFDVLEFDILRWSEPRAAGQWMPGSIVPYTAQGKPTFLISKAGRVYSVRFAAE